MRRFLTYITLTSLVLGIFAFAATSYACACGIATFDSPDTLVESNGTAKALLVYNNGVEHYVISPGLRGNAQDFGMAVAFPSRPEITKAPDNLFEELFEYTKPIAPPRTGSIKDGFSFGAAQMAPKIESVQVIETKEVGDFTTTVLTANNSSELLTWLQNNNYNAKESDLENFDYYIQKGGYYFVALKLTTINSDTRTSDYKLTPLEFTFTHTEPFIPLRLVRGTTDHKVQFNLYTYSQQPLIVNGAGLMFSSTVPLPLPSTITSLSQYNNGQAWLIKQNVLIDASKISEDLIPTVWNSPFESRYTVGTQPIILTERTIPLTAGVMQVSDPFELNFGHEESQRIYAYDDYNPPFESFWSLYGPQLMSFLIILLLHFYIGITLFFIAKKLEVHHRWRAWLPIFNISLLVSCAQKKWWWLLGILSLPILFFFLIEPPYINYEIQEIIRFIGFGSLLSIFLFEYTLLDRIVSQLAVRLNRPSWWGPLMILIPPVGLVLLGILAWSKRKPQQ